jgi:hypothetical protein
MNDLVKNQPQIVADEVYTGKVERDGMVAVLYSPEYGAGWYSWRPGNYGEEMVFDPMMVKYVEEENQDALHSYVAMRYPDAYDGGVEDLKIAWIPKGVLFRITEYDGNESVETMSNTDWIKA